MEDLTRDLDEFLVFRKSFPQNNFKRNFKNLKIIMIRIPSNPIKNHGSFLAFILPTATQMKSVTAKIKHEQI